MIPRKNILPFILFILLLSFSSTCNAFDFFGNQNKKELSFQIKIGEKASVFFKRLIKKKITTNEIIKTITKVEKFKKYPMLSLSKYSKRINKWEGQFKPGTYKLWVDEIDKSKSDYKQKYYITKKILEHLLEVNKKRLNKFGLYSENKQFDILRLASIVEKEAVVNKNYNDVASVFIKRLKKKMYIASCPSVEYALGYHRPFLTDKDSEIKSKYNLYYHKGLPPTPIAFISDAALQSVVSPVPNSYYFFVFDWAKQQHYFAVTYYQHKKYVKIARRNYYKKFGRKKAWRINPNKYYEL